MGDEEVVRRDSKRSGARRGKGEDLFLEDVREAAKEIAIQWGEVGHVALDKKNRSRSSARDKMSDVCSNV